MQTWKLTLTYDGTNYHGWQIQPGGLPTIQGVLQSALYRIVGESPLPQGSGRTDAGVHALGQVASFELVAPIPADNLLRALNRTLPPSIRVLDAAVDRPGFHARHSAQAKTYEYRIFRDSFCSPFLAPYVHPCLWKLDRQLLDQSAANVVGEHNFTSMAAVDPDQTTRMPNMDQGLISDESSVLPKSAIRTIYSSEWITGSATELLLIYRVRGNGFLHHMVRNLVGTMLEIARGQFQPNSMPSILTAQARSAAGPTAPAKGLFLHSVEYSE